MCDMCSSPEKTYRIEVEGSILNVCEKCVSFGKVVGKVKHELPEKKKKKLEKTAERIAEEKAKKETESVQLIVADYSKIIKSAREKTGLKQEELAKKIAERESVIHKLESGIMKPDIPLARKLEKFLRISLVESVEVNDDVEEKRSSTEGLTVGDLIKIKSR
jgi:putative transcription factor